ncbi:Constitutive ornithine decarboxylase [Sodalis praecaptivus]
MRSQFHPVPANPRRGCGEDAPLETVLPSICEKYPGRYQGYTLRRLCQEMHDFYVSFDAKQLQCEMFRQCYLPRMAMNPQEANMAFVRGEIELLPLSQAEGRIAAEGELPYPPGVLCVVPGEVWGGPAWRYFLALEEGLNQLPGFQPELQGVYIQQDACGTRRLYGHVVCR